MIVSVANVVIFASLAAWLWSTVRHRKGEALRLAEDLAATLYISKHTASTHVKQILHKTGVSSRRDLQLLAPFVDGAGNI